MNPPIRRRLGFTGLLSLLISCHAFAADQDNSPVIELPPFVIEESLTPPWRYASISGVEVISRSPDRLTKQLITGHHRLHTLLALMIPPELQLQRDTPLQYVIYIKDNQPAVTQEMVASIEQQEQEALAAAQEGGAVYPDDVTVGYMPNFRFWDEDSLSIFFVVDLASNDSDEITLSGSYVRYLIEDRTPALPRWYIEGMMELYPSAIFSEPSLETSSKAFIPNTISKTISTRKGITIKPFTWGSKQQAKLLKKRPNKAPALIPLESLFTLAASELQAPEQQSLWKTNPLCSFAGRSIR